MIYKGKLKASDPSNYRPISLTSCLSKFVEGFVKDRLNYFLTSNNLICFQQSGFRNQRSTHDNLLFLTQKISENFNRNKKRNKDGILPIRLKKNDSTQGDNAISKR